MSFGVHRLWKQFTLSLTGLTAGQSRARCRRRHRRSRRAGSRARWARPGGSSSRTSTAACSRPAATGCWTRGSPATSQCLLADAERLPFADDTFDCVTIGFGLRNVTDKAAALASMYRVLKPGGQLLVLEFSTPVAPGLKPLYDAYSFNVLPLLGGWWPRMRRATATSPSRSACIRIRRPCSACSRMPGFAQTPLSQSHGRHRRRPPRIQDLTCRPHPSGSRPIESVSTAASMRSQQAQAAGAPA